MKNLILSILLLLALNATVVAQEAPGKTNPNILQRRLTIEPAIGMHTNAGMDLLLSNLLQWNLQKRFAVSAHTSFNINNIASRDVNQVKTDYNHTFNQKFGIGKMIYGKRSSHSFFIMAGIKYTAYKETLENPAYEQASIAISSLSPDYGVMYSLKKGTKNCFFTFRLYLPLTPWPAKGTDINYVDANIENVALEFGLGFRLK